MKKCLLILVMLLFCAQLANAVQMELIGGIRDGLAFGIMGEQTIARNLGLRYGVEANTGHQPIIIFIGGKFYLTDFRHEMPLSLGVGFVDYAGNNGNNAGVSLSLIINRAFNLKPLFIEAGVDIAGSGRLQLQVGYKVF